MKNRIASSIVMALAIWGCQVEETAENVSIDNEAKVFTAIIEDNASKDTRTTLDNGNVLWKQGDQVSIFAASTVNEQYQVTDASDGKISASLYQIPGGVVAGTEIDNNVAFYPYTSTASVENRGASYIIRDIALPSTQYYSAVSFGNGAFPMAAVTGSAADMNLKFKNILGGLKLLLKGTATIASISITGNDNEILCGNAEVTMDKESAPSISLSDASAKTVTLDCGNGVQLNTKTGKSFIIALPPMTMTYGFTIVVTDIEGNQMEITTTKSQTITRSSLLSMPVVDYEETVITLTLEEVRESITAAQQSATLGGNVIVQAVVISNSALNNLTSRELYIQDDSAGIVIYCTEAHGFDFGDVLTLDLSNSVIKWYNGYLEIADLPLSRIQKIGHMDEVVAKEVSIEDFLNNQYESQYVAIKNSQVVNEDLGKTWVVGNKGTQIGIECSDGSEFVVYSRMTSSYGSEVVPQGSGTIKGISSKYNDVIQLIFAQDSDRMGLTGTRYEIEHEYTVSIGEDTRASWSGHELVWRAGDKVYLSDGETSAICTIPDNYDGSRTAVVKTRQSFSGDVCCVYPGDAVTRNDSYGSSLIVTVPEDQGSDGSLYSVLYGSSSTNIINLFSRTALINIKLTSAVDDLSFVRIRYEGTPIVGQIKIDDNGANVISGTQIAKVAAHGDNMFCFSVLPGSVAKMDIDVCKKDGTYGRLSLSERAISEGHAYTISVDPSTISFSGNEVTSVDLGLPSGIKWASFNLGASKPEEFGDYYAWGDPELYYSSWDPMIWKEGKESGYSLSSYKWCIGERGKLTKYCTLPSMGYNDFTDGKTVLDPEDDSAHINLGGNWRMPTKDEWTELMENCTWTWTTRNGVTGRLVTASNGNSIFLPAAGFMDGTNLRNEVTVGYYWSSSLFEDPESQPEGASPLCFTSAFVDNSSIAGRNFGFSVRPVYAK